MAKTVDNGTLTDYDVATGAGAVSDDVQRVTLASDDPAVVALQALDNAIAGNEVQVDVVTMPTVTVQDGGGTLTVDGTVAVTGTFWQATQPVSLAAVVPVNDNSGTLTVDAPVGTPVFVRLSDGSSAITTLPVSVASVPSHAVTNAGTFVTQENGAALTALQLMDDAIVADDAAFTPGTTKVSMAGFEYDDTTPDSVNEGDAGAARMSANRNQYVQIRDNAGNERGLNIDASGFIGVTDGGGSLTVDGSLTTVSTVTTVSAVTAISNALPAGTNAIGKLAANSGVDIGDVDVTSLVPGTAATSLGKAVDSVAGATDTGVALLAVRDDSLSTLTPIDGDYTHLRVSSTGALHVTGAGGGTQYNEDAAHTSGDTGTMALAVRKDTATALSGTDGDYTPLITNASGALHVAVASGSVTASGSISIATATTGGYTPMDLIDIDETEDEVKSSAGTVGGWVFTNLAASTRYVRFYNAAAASVTVGTTAAEIVIAIPAGAGVVMPVGSPGIAFSTGICVAATTGVAANDTGAPGANEVVGTVFYA